MIEILTCELRNAFEPQSLNQGCTRGFQKETRSNDQEGNLLSDVQKGNQEKKIVAHALSISYPASDRIRVFGICLSLLASEDDSGGGGRR